MKMVETGKRWRITTEEEFKRALETLEDNEFCADMSDDFRRADAEKREVARQRADVVRQARALGIL